MKLLRFILMVVLCLMALLSTHAQGFLNLNFEKAKIAGLNGNLIPATNAFPNWIASALYMAYNDRSLSGASISIMDTNTLYTGFPVQGSYTALLIGADPHIYGSNYVISLGQTGLVPVGTQSITFWGDNQGLVITFNGQLLSFSALSTAANYTVYGADISAYAGQVGLLQFAAPPTTGGTLDNIQFSNTAVPEPSALALAALGGAFLAGNWLVIRWSSRNLHAA